MVELRLVSVFAMPSDVFGMNGGSPTSLGFEICAPTRPALRPSARAHGRDIRRGCAAECTPQKAPLACVQERVKGVVSSPRGGSGEQPGPSASAGPARPAPQAGVSSQVVDGWGGAKAPLPPSGLKVDLRKGHAAPSPKPKAAVPQATAAAGTFWLLLALLAGGIHVSGWSCCTACDQ